MTNINTLAGFTTAKYHIVDIDTPAKALTPIELAAWHSLLSKIARVESQLRRGGHELPIEFLIIPETHECFKEYAALAKALTDLSNKYTTHFGK